MIDNLLKGLGSIFAIAIFLWYLWGILKLNKKEKEIFEKKSQVDNLENDDTAKRALHSGMVNQSQFEKMNDKRRKPLEAELETLKMERQFLLDKLPLMGFFKK